MTAKSWMGNRVWTSRCSLGNPSRSQATWRPCLRWHAQRTWGIASSCTENWRRLRPWSNHSTGGRGTDFKGTCTAFGRYHLRGVRTCCHPALFATFVFWYVVLKAPLSVSLQNTSAVLLAACPCPLGLATPAALVVGTGRAARQGVFFKGGVQLEQLHKTKVVLIDKTGTITHGRPIITDILLTSHPSIQSQRQLLHLAGSAELSSGHPLARVIVEYASQYTRPVNHH